MKNSPLHQVVKGALELNISRQVTDLLVAHVKPKTDVLLNQIGRIAAPTVAKLHAWCDSRQAVIQPQRRGKKSSAKDALAT